MLAALAELGAQVAVLEIPPTMADASLTHRRRALGLGRAGVEEGGTEWMHSVLRVTFVLMLSIYQ